MSFFKKIISSVLILSTLTTALPVPKATAAISYRDLAQLGTLKNYITNGGAESGLAGIALYSNAQTVTITIASPAVFTVAGTGGYYVGMPIAFTTTGALPTGLTAGTTYYVSSVLSASTFKVSTTLGGTDVNTSGTQSGTHTARPLVPTTGTSGTISGLTLAASTSSPLSGNASFLLTQSNSTVVGGQGVSYDFTIDPKDKAQVLSISFDYNASSTFSASSGQTGSDSDLEVFLYDTTNSVLIPVSPKVITAAGSNNFPFKATFQTASNSTTYRLILHASTVNSNATGWTFKFDNIYVGRQPILQGYAATDYQQYTLTIGGATSAPTLGTNTSKASWRRDGDSVEIEYFLAQTTAGTAGSGTYLFPLPPGLVIDPSVTIGSPGGSGAGQQLLGPAWVASTPNGNTSTSTAGGVYPYNTTNLMIYAGTSTAGQSNQVGSGFQALNNSPMYYNFKARVKIAGWSSNTLVSNDASTRVIQARAYGPAASSITTDTPVKYLTVDYDNSASYSTSTGQFTASVSGYYKVTARTYNAGAFTLYIWKNGAKYSQGSLASSATPSIVQDEVFLKAGDTVDVRPDATITPSSVANTWLHTFAVSINLGPSAIAATEKVYAKYRNTTNFAASSTTPVNYDTKVVDSHSAVTTSATAWRFTAPRSGTYVLSGAWTNSTNTPNVQLYTNGSLTDYLATVVTATDAISLSDEVFLNQGDYIDIRPSISSTTTGATTGTNWIAIFSQGGI